MVTVAYTGQLSLSRVISNNVTAPFDCVVVLVCLKERGKKRDGVGVRGNAWFLLRKLSSRFRSGIAQIARKSSRAKCNKLREYFSNFLIEILFNFISSNSSRNS